jgi:hypothetical protein
VSEAQSDLEKYREASAKLRLAGILLARDKKRAKLEEMKVDIVADHKAGVGLRKIFKLIPRDRNTPIGYRFFQATVAEWEERQHTPRTRSKKQQERPPRPRKQTPAPPPPRSAEEKQTGSTQTEALAKSPSPPDARKGTAETDAGGKSATNLAVVSEPTHPAGTLVTPLPGKEGKPNQQESPDQMEMMLGDQSRKPATRN